MPSTPQPNKPTRAPEHPARVFTPGGDPMHIAMTRAAQAMAILGGTVLCILILITCVSIVGRELNSFLHSDAVQAMAPALANWLVDLGIGPVTGDFELIENGMPFAIFAFLPLCQIESGHATVDVFTSRFPPRLLMWMRAITELVFAIVLVIFALKLFQGMQSKIRYGETTYLIQFPVWWAFAAAFAASTGVAIIGSYMALLRLAEAVTKTTITHESPETDL